MLPLVLSSHSRVFEPPGLWQTRLDATFRDRAPRIERIGGADQIVVEADQILSGIGLISNAGAPQQRNQRAEIAARQASAIRSLPWQRVRRSRKSPPRARGFARTISASPLLGTNGLAESRNVMGSCTPRTR